MNVTKLKQEILADEARVNKIYLDKYDHPTLGIGHLITKKDAEYGLPIGTKISDERVDFLFNKDIEGVGKDCCKLFEGFEKFPSELQLILGNMMFNLGISRFKKFERFIRSINDQNYSLAAWEMEDSLWYKQLSDRVKRLRDRMFGFANSLPFNYSKSKELTKHDIT